MEIVTISRIAELRTFITNIEARPSYSTTLHITGDLYSDLSATYIALAKCKTVKTGGVFSMVGSAVGVGLAIVTAGISLIPSLVLFAGGSAAAVLAVKEFQACPYADEVFVLAKFGYNVIQNDSPTLVLGRE